MNERGTYLNILVELVISILIQRQTARQTDTASLQSNPIKNQSNKMKPWDRWKLAIFFQPYFEFKFKTKRATVLLTISTQAFYIYQWGNLETTSLESLPLFSLPIVTTHETDIDQNKIPKWHLKCNAIFLFFVKWTAAGVRGPRGRARGWGRRGSPPWWAIPCGWGWASGTPTRAGLAPPSSGAGVWPRGGGTVWRIFNQ